MGLDMYLYDKNKTI